MKIEQSKKTNITIKNAYVEGEALIDVETGEVVNINDVIKRVYGETEVKIAITASTSEEIALPESEDSIE